MLARPIASSLLDLLLLRFFCVVDGLLPVALSLCRLKDGLFLGDPCRFLGIGGSTATEVFCAAAVSARSE